jgi:hypothetical protein
MQTAESVSAGPPRCAPSCLFSPLSLWLACDPLIATCTCFPMRVRQYDEERSPTGHGDEIACRNVPSSLFENRGLAHLDFHHTVRLVSSTTGNTSRRDEDAADDDARRRRVAWVRRRHHPPLGPMRVRWQTLEKFTSTIAVQAARPHGVGVVSPASSPGRYSP